MGISYTVKFEIFRKIHNPVRLKFVWKVWNSVEIIFFFWKIRIPVKSDFEF